MAAAAAMPASRGWVFSNRELDKAVAAFQRGELLSKAQMAMLRAAADPLFFAKEFKRAPKLSNFEPPSKRNSVGWEAFTCADETGRVTMREHTTELPRVNIKGDLLGAYRTAPEQKRSGGSSGAGGSGSGGKDKLRPSASGPPTRMGVTVPEDAADAACRKCSLRLDWSSLGSAPGSGLLCALRKGRVCRSEPKERLCLAVSTDKSRRSCDSINMYLSLSCDLSTPGRRRAEPGRSEPGRSRARGIGLVHTSSCDRKERQLA